MTMKKITIIMVAVFLIAGSAVSAQVTFEDAKVISVGQGQPILLEFFKPG